MRGRSIPGNKDEIVRGNENPKKGRDKNLLGWRVSRQKSFLSCEVPQRAKSHLFLSLNFSPAAWNSTQVKLQCLLLIRELPGKVKWVWKSPNRELILIKKALQTRRGSKYRDRAKMSFRGCVINLWAWRASHATYVVKAILQISVSSKSNYN